MPNDLYERLICQNKPSGIFAFWLQIVFSQYSWTLPTNSGRADLHLHKNRGDSFKQTAIRCSYISDGIVKKSNDLKVCTFRFVLRFFYIPFEHLHGFTDKQYSLRYAYRYVRWNHFGLKNEPIVFTGIFSTLC